MRWLSYRPRLAVAGALVVAGGGLATLAVYLWRVGLERANQLASVVAMFAALLTMVGGVVTLLWSRQTGATAGGVASARLARQRRTAWGVLRLDDEVRRLLEAMLSMAEAAPYSLLGGRHSVLSTVYVRQRLELRREEDVAWEREDSAREPGSRWGTGVRPIPVSLPLDRVLGEHPHLLLEGGPGQGKSTTVRQLCRQLALAWLDGGQPAALPAPAVPLLVSARGLAGHRTLPWPQALAHAVTGELGMRLGGAFPAELIAQPAAGVCWFVVVDGLDEVPTVERDELLGVLADRAAAVDSPYRLMITSRPLAAHARAALRASNVGHYSLVPFDRAALRSFARAWFRVDRDPTGEALAAGFLAEVRAAGLDDVTAVPLLATIAVTVYERDPARGLPRNRHDLYERYLTHLWEAGHERRQALRARMAQRLGDLLDGRRVGRGLFDRVDALLEHLAVVRLDTRDPLLPAALRWLADQRLSPGRTPAVWDRWIADLLSTTGVLKVYGTGVEFVHQSFAEHYAARVHARVMPADFAGEHPDWRRWIACAVEGEPVGLAVLTTWTRDHDATALLTWLLTGAASYQEIAVRLVSEGAPASDATVSACLRLVEHQAWTTRTTLSERVEGLFGLVRRLPAGPVVTSWLETMIARSERHPAVLAHAARLLADRSPARRGYLVDRLRATLRTADAYERPAVAEALVELAPSYRAEAAEALVRVLDDTHLSTWSRGHIATTLADLGPDAATSACSGLRAILHDALAAPGDRADTARTLVELDGDYRTEATAVLLDLLGDPAVPADQMVRVAQALVAVAPEHTAQAAAALSAMAATSTLDGWDQVDAADALAGLGPRFRPDGLAALLAILRSPLADTARREFAAARLCDHDGDHRQEALDTLLAILLDPQEEIPARGNAHNHLCHLDADQRAPAVAVLRPVLLDPGQPVSVQQDVASVLCRLDSGAVEEIGAALSRVLDAPLVRTTDVCSAATDLARLGPACYGRAVRVLVGIADDPHLESWNRRFAGDRLRNLGSEHAERAAAVLSTALDDPTAHAYDKVYAANELLRCGPGHRQRGVDALLDVILDADTPGGARETARVYLLQELPGHRSAVADAYRRLLATYAGDPDELVPLARGLGELGREHHPAAAEALCSVIDQPYATAGEQAAAAQALAGLGPEHHPAAGQVLHAVATDPYAPAHDRVAAARALLALGHDRRAAGISALRALAGDPYTADDDRCTAAEALLAVGDEHRDVAVRALRTVAADPAATATDRNAAAWHLARLGDEDGITILRQLLFDPNLPDDKRLEVARVVRRIDDPDQHRHATEVLHAVMTDEETNLAHRVSAATVLMTVDQSHRPAILTTLHRIVNDARTSGGARRSAIDALTALGCPADHDHILSLLQEGLTAPAVPAQPPAVPVPDPLTAAELLFDTAPRHRAPAVPVLRALLADPDECRDQRLRAVWTLTRGGPADRAGVVDVLVEWLGRPDLPVTDRCALASALHSVNRQRAQEVLDPLRAAIADPTTRPDERYEAASTVLAIRPGDTAAAHGLADLLGDASTLPATHRAAAESLTAGRPTHRGLAVERLRSMLDASTRRPAELVWVAAVVAQAHAANRHQALAVLEKLTAPAQAAQTRLAAATELAALPGPASVTGTAALLALGRDPLLAPYLRCRAAQELSASTGPLREQGRALLLEIAADPALDPTDRSAAACHGAALPGPTRQQALRSLDALLAEPRIPPRLVLDVAEASCRYGDGHGNAAAHLQRVADDERVHPYLRCRALRLLASHHVRVRDDATARLWKLLSEPSGNPDHRRWAAESLAGVDDYLRSPTHHALRDVDASQSLDDRARRRLRRSIQTISRGA